MGSRYRAGSDEAGRTDGAAGKKTGRFENTAFSSSQPSGRITSRYVSR